MATGTAVTFGAYFSTGLTLTVGSVSSERVRAPQEVLNYLATERNRQDALILAHGLEQIYAPNPGEWAILEHNLFILLEDLTLIREAYQQESEDLALALAEWAELSALHHEATQQAIALWEAAMAAAEPGVIPQPQEVPPLPDAPEWEGLSFELFANIPGISFTSSMQQHIMDMQETDFSMLWAGVMVVAEEVQLNIIIREIDFLTQLAVEAGIRNLQGLDSAMEDIINLIVLTFLRENAIPNEELNRAAFEQRAANYERIFFREGQIIVDEGEIVTEDIYYVLAQLGMLQTESLMDNIIPLAGVLAVIIVLFFANAMYLYFYQPNMAKSKKESLLLFTLYILTLGLIWALKDFSLPFFPLLIFPMLVAVLIDRRAAAVLTFSMVFISYFVVEGTLEFMMFYSIAGLLVGLLSRYTTERSKVFVVGGIVMVLLFGLSISTHVIFERNLSLDYLNEMIMAAVFAAVSGLLTVIVSTGSLPLWETFFGVVTPVKLLDLTNPTNALLRRLTIEAPGTYHHSLIVANLAESACYDIEANAHAARVGGYYHDIGKLKFPHYFAENLDGDNPHDHMTPTNSVQLIISHVSHGLTLASEHRLPQFVRDVIKEHHGTTTLQYFYAKARESDPDADDKDFRYPYTIPQTRESACVMLADSVEAAVRSLVPKMHSLDELEHTIRSIIRGKLNDGQLADSQLSIKDVNIIEQSFFRVLKGMYHERIAYPKAPAADAPKDTTV